MIKEFLKSILTPVFIVLAAMLGIMGVAGMFLVIFYIIYLIVLGLVFIYDYFVGMTYGKTKYDPLFKDFAYRKRRKKNKKSCLDQNYINGQISYTSDDGALRYSWDGTKCIDNMKIKKCSVISKKVFGSCDTGNMTNATLVITVYTLDPGYAIDDMGNDTTRSPNNLCVSLSDTEDGKLKTGGGGANLVGVFVNSFQDSEGIYGPGFMPRESRIEIALDSKNDPAILAPCDNSSAAGAATVPSDLDTCNVSKYNVQTYYIDNDLGEEEDYNVYYCENNSCTTINSIKFSLFKEALFGVFTDANANDGVNAHMSAALATGPLLVELKRCSSEEAVINEYLNKYNESAADAYKIDATAIMSMDTFPVGAPEPASDTVAYVLKNVIYNNYDRREASSTTAAASTASLLAEQNSALAVLGLSIPT
jgi:hypothetical protein